MRNVFVDFFQVGFLRLLARILMGVRGLFIITTLSPENLGHYTVWLLFILYFSMLECGTLVTLEREIPHYKGAKQTEEILRISNLGWSSYFYLSCTASLLLFLISAVVFHDIFLAGLLCSYLFSDKIYRGLEVNSRIHFLFRENGMGQLLTTALSLVAIWYYLPILGPYSILLGFILGQILGAIYLYTRAKLTFQWVFDKEKIWIFIKSGIPLAGVTYSTEWFHSIPLTIIAMFWSKTTLGYFTFAFRLFQLFLALFPYLIQQITRTRIYFLLGQQKLDEKLVSSIINILRTYCCLSVLFASIFYIWADWGIDKFIPKYSTSGYAVKSLPFMLLPLGIAYIFSDYLSSRFHNRVWLSIFGWLTGVAVQCLLFIGLYLTGFDVLKGASWIYMISVIFVYLFLSVNVFILTETVRKAFGMAFFLLLPILGVSFINLYLSYIMPGFSSALVWQNLNFFFISISLSSVVLIFYFFGFKKYLNLKNLFMKSSVWIER